MAWRMYVPFEYCEVDWNSTKCETPESRLQAHKHVGGAREIQKFRERERERLHTYTSTPWQTAFATLLKARLTHSKHLYRRVPGSMDGEARRGIRVTYQNSSSPYLGLLSTYLSQLFCTYFLFSPVYSL